MDSTALKGRVCAEIDRRADDVISLGREIWANPELGFKEFGTAQWVGEAFAKLGIPHRTGIAITGIKGAIEGGGLGPTVAVMGELDALAVRDHPECNRQTGAVHACGHNAQIAALVATAMGLVGSGVMRELHGRVAVIAVPAEEYIEVEYRSELRRQGKLEFLGGKAEFIRLGELDDVDLAMMTHLSSSPEDGKAGIAVSSNGCVTKQIQFIGKASHAGGAPDRGVNALGAAHVALAAIHAQRETYRDEDSIRIHPIITKGGDVVNVVPADVRMETYVRGKTIEAIEAADKKVDRALRAGAMAMGASVRIGTTPGSLPQVNDPELAAVYRANAISLHGEAGYATSGHHGGGTDMGDVQHIMPAIHPYHYGGVGASHGRDYRIDSEVAAYLEPAKLMAMTVVNLLSDEARVARSIVSKSKPRMSKDEYLAFVRKMFREELYES